LFLAAVGLALSLAARWQIRRSESTRAGLMLANAGLWVSLLFGLGYGAYYAGTEAALRKQAEAAADQWFGLLVGGKPEEAFRLTLPPAQQRGVPENAEDIRRRFGATELALFLRSDLPRMCRSWPDKVKVRTVGVREWEVKPTGFQVDLNYEVRTPEGQYDVVISTVGTDDPAGGGRDWQVMFQRSGIRDTGRRLTKLGRLCLELQARVQRNFLPEWAKGLPGGPSVEPLIRLEGAVPPEDKRATWAKEMRLPGAVNLFPGSGPLRPPGMPTAHITADDVFFANNSEVSLPSLGGSIATVLVVRPTDATLIQEMLRLAGPGWENQPVEPLAERPPELAPYNADFRVVEINIKPSAPKLAQQPINES
jgi:hypothetical protein